mmetsp:Transcript_27516/g.62695  ORF Transcript_27516/g.62695 Transcript_27516/m.62695 type:complete len:160 (-) Transcript_27516:48-527(-)
MVSYSTSVMLQARVAVLSVGVEGMVVDTAVYDVVTESPETPVRSLRPGRRGDMKESISIEDQSTAGESSDSEESVVGAPPGLTQGQCRGEHRAACTRWNAGACKARPGTCRFGHYCSDCGIRNARHKSGSRFCPHSDKFVAKNARRAASPPWRCVDACC